MTASKQINPSIYIVRADMEDGFEEEHHEWYRRRHAPDVLGVGFFSARGYVSAASPKMWNIYEVPGVELFKDDVYNNMHKNDPFVPVAVSKLHGRTVSVYDQLKVVGNSGGAYSSLPSIAGPVLSFLRFDTDAAEAEVEAWFDREVVDRHRGLFAARTIRLFQQRQQHPKWPTAEPIWAAVVEWRSSVARDDARADLRLGEAVNEAAGIALSNTHIDLLHKHYGLMREDLFPPLPAVG